VTRQRRWQLRKQAAGGCITCGQPRGRSRRYCDGHLDAWNRYTRRRAGPRVAVIASFNLQPEAWM